MEPEFDNAEKEMRGVLNAWRDSAHNRTERPEWFWARQRARVASQATAQSASRVPKLAWAGLAATVALAIALIAPGRPQKPIEQPAPAAKAEISDHDLMVALERTMDDGVPSSLAPAGLLANEMNQALVTNVHSQKSKEKQYEE